MNNSITWVTPKRPRSAPMGRNYYVYPKGAN